MQTPYSGTTPGGTFQGPTSAVAGSNSPTHLTRATGKQRRRCRQHRVAKNPETPMPHRQRLAHHGAMALQKPKSGITHLRRRLSTRPTMAAMPTQQRPEPQPLRKGTLHPLAPKRLNR
ncbi:Hypothetical predicted protein [Pelobates cultripes]|uniref:Uncharacterized protein n=1 Tax=Pelobates cultripes TaxID=61616 RepID=A0AAD1R2S4_PELCU|nr:Hypothetical predicted protein [Pelobates cultripes]